MKTNRLYNNYYKINQNLMIIYLVVIFVFLQIFFSPPFNIAGFQFEWSFFASMFIIINIVFHSRKFRKDKVFLSLIIFIFYSLILSVISFLRFDTRLAFVGFAHLTRAILLFIPFIWIIAVINKDEQLKLVRLLRIIIYTSLFVLFVLILKDGYLFNDLRLETLGLGKNSLGYTLVCFLLFFMKYENYRYVKKPAPKIIWISMILISILATKSGTAIIFALLIFIYTVIFSKDIKMTQKIIGIILLVIVFLSLIFHIDSMIEMLDKMRLYKVRDFLYSIVKSQGGSIDTSNQSRLEVQLRLLSEFDFSMAIGRFYYYYFAKHGYTAHQQYLQILYDTGVIGIGLFLRFVGNSIKQAKFKFPVILVFLYSFIENFLIQFIGLVILALLIIDVPERKEKNV
jgi:hypothetical protein